MKNIYMDNNATTKVAPEVIDSMQPFFTELWGNPSSMHAFGGQVADHIDKAREKVASLIGADPSEIFFTSCGTESDNMAISGAAEAMGPGTRVITSRVEHLAVLGPVRHLQKQGYPVVEIGVDNMGRLDLEELEEGIRGTPALVSTMWANNETGVVFPIKEIAERVKNKGGVFHTDAVQAVGKLPINVSEVPVDMLSLSGHKLHAPKGVAALYIRKGTRLNPFLIGGHQEAGKRGGTENVPYIVGLGKACELAAEAIEKENTHVRKLRDKLENGLLQTCSNVTVNGDRQSRLPNTTNLSFEFIEGEAILYSLSDEGIAASSGSACTSGSLEPSHVIRAMGIPFTLAHGSIRFSLSKYTTEEEVDYTLEKVPPIISHLREMSPFT